MGGYKIKIIWIDDEWETTEGFNLLTIRQEIENTLKNEIIHIECEPISDSTKAYKIIDQNARNYVFAIVDLSLFYNKNIVQYTAAEELFIKLKEKKIFYAIYSNYAEKVKSYDSYCIGSYKKGIDKKDILINDLKKFFECLPFRLLQISDIHYNVDMNAHDREIFLSSLEKKLIALDVDKKINIVTIAGDLVASKPAEELSLVAEKIKHIFERIKIHEDRIFLVPGNHEVIWSDFLNKKRTQYPYSGYAQFCNFMFSRTILSNMEACTRGNIPTIVNEDGLTWHRTLLEPQVSIIGICSNSSQIDEQGLGRLSESNIEYIKHKWDNSKKPNELRILLLHHNFFPVQSFNSRDENRTLINAGTALNTLTQTNCDLILSGHTHRSEVILYQSSSLNDFGYNYNKTLLLVASGTSGGITPTGDFAKSFNILDISKNINEKTRNISITPYFYDSRTETWEGRKNTEYSL